MKSYLMNTGWYLYITSLRVSLSLSLPHAYTHTMNSHMPTKILSTEPLIYNNLQVICNIPNHAEVMLIEDMPFRLCPWHATDPQVKSCVCVGGVDE